MVTLEFSHIEHYRRVVAGGLLGPYLPVVLRNGEFRVPAVGLLDSGADHSVFDWEIGLALGLIPDDEHQIELEILGGTLPGYRYKVELDACGITFEAPVSFVPDWPFDSPLLGRADFFHAFRIAFEHRNSRMLLSPFSELRG